MDDTVAEQSCRYDLVICCVFQNESRFLREWIEFHQMMGVQRFFLVNDRSSDDYGSVLRPYCEAGIVQLLENSCPEKWAGRRFIQYQVAVLQALCHQLRGVARWVALIDVDEFVVPTATPTVLDYLREHEDSGAIYAEWRVFGTSRVRRLADGELLTARMTSRMGVVDQGPQLGKSIVKPHRLRRADIHRCDLLPGFDYVDSHPGPNGAPADLQINHYWTRDEEFLIGTKLPRAAMIKGWTVDQEQLNFHRRAYNDIEDHTISRFLPGLERRLRQ